MRKLKLLGKILETKYALIIGILFGIVVVLLELPYYVIIWFAIIFFCLAICILILIDKRSIIELDDKCNPYNFLEIVNYEIKSIYNKQKNKQNLILNKTAGLCEIGSFDEAICLLDDINVNKLNSIFKAVYYDNNTACYIGKLNLEKAEENLNELLKLIDSGKINKIFIELIKESYKLNLLYLNIYKGNFDNCVNQLEDLCLKVKKLRLKVHCRFAIGYCYYMNKDELKAKENFEYVIKNGNKLYIVTQAQEYIDKMNQLIHITH